MSSRKARIFCTGALAALLGLPLAQSEARGVEEKSDQATTEQDRTEVSVTVYNSNLALVRDVRQIHLPSGVLPLRFEDVAASILPATVHFRSLSEPAKLSVVEQNYEYDLLDPPKLLEKYVGRELTVLDTEADGTTVKRVPRKALLLADNSGGTVWRIGDEIVTNAEPYRFPDLPGNLYTRPTLLWTLDNRGGGTQKVEASYLTNNINWSADYVLTVGREEKSADLDGWVTIVNNSGARYPDAKLQLVAGSVHRTKAGPLMNARDYAQPLASSEAAAKQFEQEGFGEYHLYTLERRTSIENNESKQITLLDQTDIPVEKYLSVDGQPSYYRNPQGIGNALPEPVKVFYRFKNDQKSGLGMPLPAGTVRVYEADSKGGVQFAGEDTIGHTPKDEVLRIYTGNAFDVVCERRETDYKRLAPNLFEMEYQITLRNHKEVATRVEVREPIGGDWEVLSSNYAWTKLDASTIGFQIPVNQDGAATLDYRVRVKW
jgi:hypothetical protein